MKALALFGAAGVLTATLAGGPVAIVIGNLALVAATCALFMSTVNLTRARS